LPVGADHCDVMDALRLRRPRNTLLDHTLLLLYAMPDLAAPISSC
jgi:hypothetical protein